MLGKTRRKKVKKTIFYSQEYRDQKMFGKKIVAKKTEKTRFIFTRIS